MTVLDAEPKDPPHILCLPMTVTEDRILREIYRNSGRMNSEVLRSNLVLSESVDNVYGAIGALREMRYIDAEIIDANDWQHNYRPLRLSHEPGQTSRPDDGAGQNRLDTGVPIPDPGRSCDRGDPVPLEGTGLRSGWPLDATAGSSCWSGDAPVNF